MKNIRAIIVDDEPLARQLLKGILEEHCPQVEIVELCSNLPEGVKAIRKQSPDIVFLDIEMPGHSGLELLDFFNPSEVNFSIIFTTAYNQYAVNAFKLSAIDYILKPLEPESIVNSLTRFEESKSKFSNFSILKENLSAHNQDKKLAIHTINSIHFIELKTICFLKAEGAYTNITLKNGTRILSSKSLKYFEQMLEEQTNFIRCHKSFIVNINEITQYLKTGGGSLIINGIDEINVSSDKVKFVLEKLKV